MPAAPAAATIDPKFILPFVNSARHVLREAAGWESTIDKPRLKSPDGSEYDYSAIISFSDTIVGNAVVSFHRELAIQLINAFVGCEIAPDTADFADALGELANQIVGMAKVELGLKATISVPSVVMGRGHIIARPSGIPCVVVPCNTAQGQFAVEIAIKAA